MFVDIVVPRSVAGLYEGGVAFLESTSNKFKVKWMTDSLLEKVRNASVNKLKQIFG
jgi:hypothetical protein